MLLVFGQHCEHGRLKIVNLQRVCLLLISQRDLSNPLQVLVDGSPIDAFRVLGFAKVSLKVIDAVEQHIQSLSRQVDTAQPKRVEQLFEIVGHLGHDGVAEHPSDSLQRVHDSKQFVDARRVGRTAFDCLLEQQQFLGQTLDQLLGLSEELLVDVVAPVGPIRHLDNPSKAQP